MNFKVLISAVLASLIAVVGCSSDSNGGGAGSGGDAGSGGSGGDAGSAGEGGAGGDGFGGFPAADCDNLPDLTGYAVGDFYEVPDTATDDCDAMFEDGAMNSSRLNIMLGNSDPGDVICMAEGTYTMEGTITIAIPDVTLKGVGSSPDNTVLNFGGPGTGKGILVQQDDVAIENMWVKNTGDNSVQQEQVTGSVFRKLHVSWDINGDNMSLNGAYALYPTDCASTTVEFNQLQGASDAGIYVGKCGWGAEDTEGGLVQYNVVHENVLGLEVENSLNVVVHDNTMVNNTAGLLSLQQPISELKPSNTNVVWYDNNSYCNNHPNFAATGVAQIAPPGSGAIIYSGDGQELYHNRFQNNDTGGVLIISNYFICQIAPPTDCNRPDGYVPYPLNIYVHDNYYDGNGENVQGAFAPFFEALGIGTPENPVEDVFWDGYIYPEAPGGDPGICLGADNTASYRDATNNQCQEDNVDCTGVSPEVCEALITACAVTNQTTDTTGRLCDAPL